MKKVTLGKTGITAVQNGFGALPIQRISKEDAVKLLRRAYDGGMRFFDTARAYSDSEEKLGEAFGTGYVDRDDIIITTKTTAKTPEAFWKDLETSLEKLRTEYIDVYQFHLMGECWLPGGPDGMYDCMLEAKKQGKIRHIGGTAHKIGIAEAIAESGVYETLQYPISYLADDREIELIRKCQRNEVGLIAMKALAGGLITDSRAAMAFMGQFDGLMPIWGIQRESELDEWLSYMDDTPVMDDEIREFIRSEIEDLKGEFCRGCGYCMPCTVGIQINTCNRMALMLRRAPSDAWLNDYWQAEMKRAESCLECGACLPKCPYGLDIPSLLKKNIEDYKKVLAGTVKI
ncbi:MAG: aldo/keto reductase [Lachnospiraceae bacterium]|nr:aldo/keto reductase [Lachnospiraceae bacterium]